MKTLLALFALLPCLVFGQGFGSFHADQPFLSASVIETGDIAASLKYQWLSTTVATNTTFVVGLTDVVSSFVILAGRYQVSANLTNDPNGGGLVFHSNNSLSDGQVFMTDQGVINFNATNSSAWALVKPKTVTTNSYIFFGKENYQNVYLSSTGLVFSALGSVNTKVSSEVPNNTLLEICMVTAPSGVTVWTNGVSTASGSTGPCGQWGTNEFTIGVRYNGGWFPRDMHLYELRIYTNQLTSAQRTALHTYATNTYGVFP